jgi:aspartyl/glutamyl-tRNA(Asn/Gln) amidotransferase C subunit
MSKPKIDVPALAKLARLEVSKDELLKLEREIPDILHFVETIQGADVSKVDSTPQLRNVMRADENPIESGTFTEKLLDAAPARQGDRIAVKQVISRKK